MIPFGYPTDVDARRLRNEFLSMPGLSLTVAQTARLLTIRLERARDMLDELEHGGFLVRGVSGEYRRAGVVVCLSERASANH